MKIVTVNGHVTLNGVVRSEVEKSSVEAKAIHVAGVDKVRDELQVAPQRYKSRKSGVTAAVR